MSDSRPPKPKRQWYQFSLRSLLLLLLLASLALSAWSVWRRPYRRQEEAMAALEDYAPNKTVIESGPPAWFSKAFGPNHINQVVTLDLERQAITDHDLQQLRGLVFLRKLYLARTDCTGDGLRYLSDMQRLHTLSLWGTGVDNEGLAHLGKLKNLAKIDLHETQITDEGLAHLKTLPKLKHLILRSTNVGDAGMEHLREIPSLRRLDLCRTGVTTEGIETLAGTQIAYLRVSDTVWDDDEGFPACMGGLKNLRELQLPYRGIVDDDLVPFMDLPRLEVLNLDHCVITDEGLVHLGRMGSLKELHLQNNPLRWRYEGKEYNRDLHITEAGLARLARLKHLETLNLNSVHTVTDDGLAQLAKLSNLRRLSLAQSAVTDDGLAHLALLENLEYLDISWTKVTDRGLTHLRGLSKLQAIDAYDCMISNRTSPDGKPILPGTGVTTFE